MKKVIVIVIVVVIVILVSFMIFKLINSNNETSVSTELQQCIDNAVPVTGIYDYEPTGTTKITLDNKTYTVTYLNDFEQKGRQLFEIDSVQYKSTEQCFK